MKNTDAPPPSPVKVFFVKWLACCWPIIDAAQDAGLAVATEIAITKIKNNPKIPEKFKEAAIQAVKKASEEANNQFDTGVEAIIKQYTTDYKSEASGNLVVLETSVIGGVTETASSTH
jgi:hypothetical protein